MADNGSGGVELITMQATTVAHKCHCPAPSRAMTRTDAGLLQYLWLIGNSSAGNSVITRQPLSVTTTSSSMRAAEYPSVAGQ